MAARAAGLCGCCKPRRADGVLRAGRAHGCCSSGTRRRAERGRYSSGASPVSSSAAVGRSSGSSEMQRLYRSTTWGRAAGGGEERAFASRATTRSRGHRRDIWPVGARGAVGRPLALALGARRAHADMPQRRLHAVPACCAIWRLGLQSNVRLGHCSPRPHLLWAVVGRHQRPHLAAHRDIAWRARMVWLIAELQGTTRQQPGRRAARNWRLAAAAGIRTLPRPPLPSSALARPGSHPCTTGSHPCTTGSTAHPAPTCAHFPDDDAVRVEVHLLGAPLPGQHLGRAAGRGVVGRGGELRGGVGWRGVAPAEAGAGGGEGQRLRAQLTARQLTRGAAAHSQPAAQPPATSSTRASLPAPPGKGAHAGEHGEVLLVAQHARHANVADLGGAVPRQQDVGCGWGQHSTRAGKHVGGGGCRLACSLQVWKCSCAEPPPHPAAQPPSQPAACTRGDQPLTALEVQVHDAALVEVIQTLGHVKQHPPAAAGAKSGGQRGGGRRRKGLMRAGQQNVCHLQAQPRRLHQARSCCCRRVLPTPKPTKPTAAPSQQAQASTRTAWPRQRCAGPPRF